MAKIDRAKTIYEAAIALPPERRTAFVEAQAGGDAELAAMVRDLIDATPSEGVTAIAPEPNASEDGTPAWPATARDGASEPVTLGPYRLLSKLGEGGFGVVWEAEQSAPVRRRVAVKIVKPGMDSASVVARFEAERQALAVMNHPCIAKVFDGGQTPDAQGARPYFVMELVRGDPITSFCDLNKLGLNERVDLMVRVCDAVQHAHTKGIIHRDLKPSNVLVQYQDGRPQPKVIDFGVAKAINQRLSEKTVFTDRGQMIGTPEYMSPEQAEMSGVDIDTRSDVYSLGVMLYELLTGALPFDSRSLRSAGFAEIQRIIREVEPPKPSTRLSGRSGEAPPERRGPINRDSATRTLRRDLDWVIMRCLEKSRDRRYETAKSLGEDLGRYLRHEPVQAGPPSVGYRTQKFLRRHRVGATLVSGVSLALVAGVIGTTWQWRQSERNRIEAERRLESIRGFSGDLLGALDRDLAGLPGGTGARRAAAEAAVQMLNELAEDEANASLIAIDLARAYRRASIIGAEGGAPLDQTVGRLREAISWAERAPLDASTNVELALAHASLGQRLI
ncbi:MAG: serine/threonine-protein kinase, partial [Planctomycetota bacterium]